MPKYNCCSNCGYSQHENHGAKYCPECGTKLQQASDSRDVCPEEKQKAYQEFKEARDRFQKLGGKV